MTISRFKIVILGLAIALLFFAFGWWSYPSYVDRKWGLGEQAAQSIAQECGIPEWALYYDIDGRRQTAGRGRGDPQDAGIYMQSNYKFCAKGAELRPIQCAEAEATRRGYKFVREFRTGGCEGDGTAE